LVAAATLLPDRDEVACSPVLAGINDRFGWLSIPALNLLELAAAFFAFGRYAKTRSAGACRPSPRSAASPGRSTGWSRSRSPSPPTTGTGR